MMKNFQSRFDYAWNKSWKSVIFDLDGVIIDSMPFYYEAWRVAFKEVGINISKDDIYMREGRKREDHVIEIHNKYKREKPSKDLIQIIIRKKEEIYRRIFKINIIPGIPELLSDLKGKNIKFALVTGSTSEKIRNLKKEEKELFEKFDVIVTAEDTKNGKPHPEPYVTAVEKLREEFGILKEDCCVVENAPEGIKSAKEAKLFCFAVIGPSILHEEDLLTARPDIICKDIKELQGYLIWADTDIPLKDFIEEFENCL